MPAPTRAGREPSRRRDWVTTLPDELVPTDNAKALSGCPNGPAEICDLPDEIPAQGVATSVAIGPDGAYYVSELKGFPAPLGMSRIWRIEPGTRHVHCDADVTDGPCTLVADGFTSIVDLTFDSDGTAYVTELDEASWFAVEVATDGMVGGTVTRATRPRGPARRRRPGSRCRWPSRSTTQVRSWSSPRSFPVRLRSCRWPDPAKTLGLPRSIAP